MTMEKLHTTKEHTIEVLEGLQAYGNEKLDMLIQTAERAFDYVLHTPSEGKEVERLCLLEDLDMLADELKELRPLDCETLNDDDDE